MGIREVLCKFCASEVNTEGETEATEGENHSKMNRELTNRGTRRERDGYRGSHKAIYFGLRMRCINARGRKIYWGIWLEFDYR